MEEKPKNSLTFGVFGAHKGFLKHFFQMKIPLK